MEWSYVGLRRLRIKKDEKKKKKKIGKDKRKNYRGIPNLTWLLRDAMLYGCRWLDCILVRSPLTAP